MKKNIKNWLWVMVIGFAIIAMILVLTGCFGEKVAKTEETQATTKEASETTTEDTTQAAILAELKNLNKSIGDLKSSLSTEEATETTEVAATTEETTEITAEETTAVTTATKKTTVKHQIQDKAAQAYFQEKGRYPFDKGNPAWVIMESTETSANAGEGGGFYNSIGAAKYSVAGEVILVLPYQENNVYQLYVKGLPSDGTLKDLNTEVKISDYAAGFGIYGIIPEGNFIDEGWALQQVVAGFKYPNCGNGCSKVTVVVHNLATGETLMWEITNPNEPADWQRI